MQQGGLASSFFRSTWSNARHQLDLVSAQDVDAFGHQGSNDSFLISSAAKDLRRLLAKILVAPLHETRERHIEVATLGVSRYS